MVKLFTIVSATCVAYAGATRINFENGKSVAFLAATTSTIRGGSDVYDVAPSLDEIKVKANKKVSNLIVFLGGKVNDSNRHFKCIES